MLMSWTLLRSVTVQLCLHEFFLLMNCWWHVCITWNKDKCVIVLRRMRKVQSETAHLTGAPVFFCSLLRWLPIILESDYSILLVVHMICFLVVAQGDDNFYKNFTFVFHCAWPPRWLITLRNDPQKWKFYYNFLTLMLFQICIDLFPLLNTK